MKILGVPLYDNRSKRSILLRLAVGAALFLLLRAVAVPPLPESGLALGLVVLILLSLWNLLHAKSPGEA